MSEVKLYSLLDCKPGELYVAKPDYDALQSRLDAAERKLGEAVKALKFYADGDHLLLADSDSWDTCSGEPRNFLHDEAGTASVEDGSIAKAALDALLSSAEPVKCRECGGNGVIGRHSGQTPESYCEWNEDCPACDATGFKPAKGGDGEEG